MNKSLPRATGFIYLLLAALLVSSTPIAVKIGLRQAASPLELVTVRTIVGVAVLWAYFLCFRRDRLRLDRAGLIGCMQTATANAVSMSAYFFTLATLDASLTSLFI